MNIAKYFWELNETALRDTQRALKDPRHPDFPQRMCALLSRCDKHKEIFSLFSKEGFMEFWPKVKSYWLRRERSSDYRDWWQTTYEQLLGRQKKEKARPVGRPSVFLLEIGRSIKEARLKKGLCQKELSAITGIKQPDISRIEEGKKNITLKTLFMLSSVLKIKTLRGC